MKQYFWNILISFDQFVNTVFGGDPDETISSRTAKNMHLRGFHELGKFLEKIDPGHLEDAVEKDEGDDASYKFPGEK